MEQRIKERLYADPQQVPVFCICNFCGGEIYIGQAYYAVDSFRICKDCLPDFAKQYFRPSLRRALPARRV